ncbi:sugar phosphate permease [Scopulibacillus daqui]|uniref:Sugar phosphate permease n=1 Tax=Scopulibacillus daqui TaxID=1469162 RepID=A0ABS2PVU9_9BACL|nr:MFS transporter [Scopulibacillus daqui]MBM7644093.1 sugar phosphate permease [Scopulibacillus daqui]
MVSSNRNLSYESSLEGEKTNFRWWFAVALWFLLLISYIDRTNISIAGPFMVKEGVVTQGALALSNSLFLFMYGISNIFGGYFSDRFGARKTALFALIWWSVMTLFTGLIWSSVSLIMSRVLLGLGEGMHWPLNSKWVKAWFPSHERARANMFWEFGLTMGPIMTGPLVTWMILSSGTWKTPFIVMALIGLIMMVPIVWLIAKDRPEESAFVSKKELSYIQAGRVEEAAENVRVGQVLRKTDFWLLLINWVGMATVFYGILFWLPSYLMEVRRISVHMTGFWYMMPYILMTICIILTAFLSDKWMKRSVFAGAGTLIAGLGLFLGTHADNIVLAMLLISISSAMNGVVLPTIWSSLQRMFPSKSVGMGAGLLNGLQNIIAAIGTYILGISFSIGFSYLIILALIGGISGLILAKRGY